MHALTFSRFGGPEVLEWTQLPDPLPEPGVAILRTRAIGLNFADIYRRQGRYHLAGSPPWIAGYEAAGEILALHPHDEQSGWRRQEIRYRSQAGEKSVHEKSAVELPHACMR